MLFIQLYMKCFSRLSKFMYTYLKSSIVRDLAPLLSVTHGSFAKKACGSLFTCENVSFHSSYNAFILVFFYLPRLSHTHHHENERKQTIATIADDEIDERNSERQHK
jgi:hypothetical protein